MNHFHIRDFRAKMSLRQTHPLQKDGGEKQKSQWATIVSFPWSMWTIHLDNTNGGYEAKQQGCNWREILGSTDVQLTSPHYHRSPHGLFSVLIIRSISVVFRWPAAVLKFLCFLLQALWFTKEQFWLIHNKTPFLQRNKNKYHKTQQIWQ